MCNHVVWILSIMAIVRLSIQQQDIIINDNCPSNTNILNLNTFINFHPSQYKMKYTLSKIYKIHEYLEIKNDKLYTRSLIDLDMLCSEISECCDKTIDYCDLKINIFYHSSVNSMTQRSIRLHIKDINDHSPQFDKPVFEIDVSEGKKDQSLIELPLAKDDDFGRNRIQNYQFGQRNPSSFDEFFSLVLNKDQPVPTQVSLRLNKMLDRETIGSFSFELLAIDGDSLMKKTGSTLIKIKVLDENDNRPIFDKTLYRVVIKEGVFTNSAIIELTATDKDEGDNGKVLYNLSSNDISHSKINELFRIDSSGKIYLKKALDFERKSLYRFTAVATNPTVITNNGVVMSTATVEIEVENVNDEPLQIIVDYPEGRNYSTVTENVNDIFIAVITTRSMESDRKSFEINCRLRSFGNFFELIPKHSDDLGTKSFEVRTLVGIDRETNARIETTISCSESNTVNEKYSEAPLTVIVTDVNDNAPTLKIDGRTSVRENEKKGKVVFSVKANDPDEGDNGTVTFSLEKSDPATLEYLKIDKQDGNVRVNGVIDCEASYVPLTELSITVTATDHGNPAKTTDMKLTVRVEDVNDNIPIFVNTPLHFVIAENSPLYTLLGDIEVKDKDYSDKVTLKIVTNNKHMPPFVITTRDNKIFQLNSTRSIDREKDAIFKFDIVAVDELGKIKHTAKESVEVKVLDVNDNVPTIIFPTQNNASVHRISYLEQVNYRLILVSANDLDQLPDNNRLEYFIEDDTKIFSITNEDKFIVTQREMTKHDIGEHRIRIVVRDYGTPRLESSVSINIVIDQSSPKSISLGNNHRLNFPNGDRSPDSILSVNSDILLYIIVITVLFIIVIIIVVFVYVIRRCKTDNTCLRNLFSMCNHSSRQSPVMSKSMISGPTSKLNSKEEKQIYNNHQATLLNNELLINERNSLERWNTDNNQAQSYNTGFNPYMTSKGAYTKLPNQSQCYFPFQYPNIYQTIEDAQFVKKQNDFTFKRMASYRPNVKNDEQYKSELNLKKWNLSASDSTDCFAGDNVPGVVLVTSHTPAPTRSRTVTNTILDADSVNENFAVAFPQDQSTFV